VIFIIPAMICAALIGYLAHQKWPSSAESVADLLMRGILYLLAPVLIIVSLTRFELTVENIGGIICVWAGAICAGLVAFWAAKKLIKLANYQAAALANAAMLFNAGFGTAMVGAFLGVEHLPDAVALDMLGHIPLIIFVGFLIGARYGRNSGTGFKEKAISYGSKNPLLYAAIVGLIIPKEWFSEDLFTIAAIGTAWLVVFAFFTVGVKLRSELNNSETLPLRPTLSVAIGTRFIVAPLIAAALMLLFIGEINKAYIISFAAAPVAYNSLLIAHVFRLSEKIAVSSLVITTLISFGGAGLVLLLL
jgi:predicted permease